MAATARARRVRRILGTAAALAVLAALPALVAARPAPADRDTSADGVLAAIRASAGRSYSGYAESSGSAAIPDVSELGTLPSLLGDTTKLRVWWTSTTQWRVDQLGPTSENDTYAFPGGTWEWASATRTATAVTARAPVRLLRPADLTPDQLGRLLVGAAAAPTSHVARIGARRYAGRTALGVEITGGTGTTVGAVDVWADAATGVPLAVQVIARGQRTPTIATAYLSFDPSAPLPTTDTFEPPADAHTQEVDDTALRGVLGRLRPLQAPPTAGGLPASAVLPGEDGVATYASGLAQVAVVSLSGTDARRLAGDIASVADPGTAGGVTSVSTPLVNLTLVQRDRRNLLVAGTVPQSTLAAVAEALLTAPPVFQQ